MGAGEDQKGTLQLKLYPNGRPSHGHVYETPELREVCEVLQCTGTSTCRCTLSGHVGNQCRVYYFIFLYSLPIHSLLFHSLNYNMKLYRWEIPIPFFSPQFSMLELRLVYHHSFTTFPFMFTLHVPSLLLG